jgi:hypothetical protein
MAACLSHLLMMFLLMVVMRRLVTHLCCCSLVSQTYRVSLHPGRQALC